MQSIRPYRTADLPILQELTAAAFDGVSIDQGLEREFGPTSGRDWRWRKMRHIADDAARDPAGILVMQTVDGEIVGFISTWCDHEAGIGHIPNLVVAEGFRRTGCGRQLIEAALDRFRELGMSHARIETLVQNTAGHGLYESLGFREIARQIHFGMKLS
ncbi:MAG: GNAT family N-acetyltransferase [Planctomycetaceae bacterium]|nr:GNAT family N-acetyltransferase [Planctomycetaceae bacterium]